MVEADYAARIDAAKDDAAELGRIADELQSVPGTAAAALRFRAIRRRMALRAPLNLKATRPVVPPPPAKPPATWLSRLGIEAVTGIPLHRYGVSQEGFKYLTELLRERRGLFLATPGREFAGQFVLWAAEWFRRSYDGSGQRWEALATPLGVRCAWSDWRRLTDLGMAYWRLEPLRIGGIHHRLAAIARQGGFPVAALEREAGGWAPRFLEALIAALTLSGVTTLDAADAAAEDLMGLVPTTWRNREMRIVSSELALEVVRLRRLAEADSVPAGALVTPWLDQHHPGWRETLPLSVGSDAARALIDGLMRAVTLQGGSGSVRCSRWLEIAGGKRSEGVELSLSGILADASGRAIAKGLSEDWSRLRLLASGPLAQHIAGELAVADPDEGGIWRARAATTRTRFEVPPDVPVTAELRGAGQRVTAPFLLAGGDPVPSGLRVYASDGAEAESAMRLRLLGTGSGAYREDILYIDAPPGWDVAAHGENSTAEQVVPGGGDERSLWRGTGSIIATSPRADRYLVRSGQKASQRDRLILMGRHVHGCAAADSALPVLEGAPTFLLKEGRQDRGAAPGELWWRACGASAWRSNPAEAGPGLCEFGWRDRVTGHVRDRRDAVLLPPGFRLDASRIGDWNEIKVSGWSGTVSANAGNRHGHACWRIPAKANPRSRLSLTFEGAEGGPFTLEVPLRHQAWIESWEDGPVRREARLSLSTINRFVARVAGRCELLADLLDRNKRPVPQGSASWWVEDELPLSSIRDDLAALLRPFGDIHATIRLNFNDGNEDYWFVGEFAHELHEERRGLVPQPAIVEDSVRVAARALADPTRERDDLGGYGLADTANHRPIMLPRMHGSWLVYLRANDRVLSCPRIVDGEPLAVLPQSGLGRAMSLADWSGRQEALRTLCDDALADPTSPSSRAFVRQVIELALSLDGLPPATFDVLQLICERPKLGALMIFLARRDEIEPLLRLEEGLPFAWCLVPRSAWYEAAAAHAEYLFERVPDEPALVAGAIGEVRTAICTHDAVLAPLLELGGATGRLQELANDFLNRSGDRIERSKTNPFRPLRDPILPRWPYLDEYRRALDAPVVAARAAQEKIALEQGELACLKDIARRHPRWFQEAFAAALKES